MKRFLIACVLAAAVTACALVFAAAAIRSEQDKPAVVKPAPPGEVGIYRQRLSGVRLGTPVQHRGLDVYPLLGGSQEPFYDTLDSALKKGSLVIEELSRVNEACVTNKGTRPVLILDGEQIVGAKQNRVFKSSLLAPPGESLIAKVSCVEHGRWSGVSARFEASGLQLFARARQANQAAVGRSMASASALCPARSALSSPCTAKSSVRLREDPQRDLPQADQVLRARCHLPAAAPRSEYAGWRQEIGRGVPERRREGRRQGIPVAGRGQGPARLGLADHRQRHEHRPAWRSKALGEHLCRQLLHQIALVRRRMIRPRWSIR